jgi:hypothetical protein
MPTLRTTDKRGCRPADNRRPQAHTRSAHFFLSCLVAGLPLTPVLPPVVAGSCCLLLPTMVPNRRIRSPPQAKRKSTIHKHSAKTAAATAFYVVAFTTLPACQSLTTSPHFRTPTTRTRSFGAVWADNFASLKERKTKVHTLILGSHPSVTSLEQNRYYAHKQK